MQQNFTVLDSARLDGQWNTVDNGTEFNSKVRDRWAYENKVILDFAVPESRLITPLLNRSMAACEPNARTRIGFCLWKMPARRENPGVAMTTSNAPIALWALWPDEDLGNSHRGWYRNWGRVAAGENIFRSMTEYSYWPCSRAPQRVISTELHCYCC